MTTVIVVRHGESLSNLNKTFTGQWDAPLTELGHQQAKNTAVFLKDHHIDAIYSSDLNRAIQTAEPTAEPRGLAIVPDARLREIHGGDWQGRTGAVIAQMYPVDHETWKTDIENSRPGGVESYGEVSARMHAFFDEIVQKHRGQSVAVFSHALALRTMAQTWLGAEASDDRLWMTNASVSILEYDDDNVCHVKLFSYDKHHGKDVTALSKGLTS